MSNNEHSTLRNIPIEHLILGMYVKSVSPSLPNNQKVEGYIRSQQSIDSLVKAKITHVVIVTSKTKALDKIDRVFANIDVTPPQKKLSTARVPEVSMEQELSKANKLYKSAKSLQNKLLNKIKLDQTLKTDEIVPTTNAIVDSIFRNQDALSCLSRIENKSSYLMEHSINVAILMSIFAKHLGIEKRITSELALGAFLHDIGKILLPSEILSPTKPLTEPQTKILNSHVNLGIKVLESTPSISHIAVKLVKEHHERLDGSGFPDKLTAINIDLYSRMIAIVDSYDAMVCGRVNKKAIYPINAFKALVNDCPEKYDEELVDKFIQCIGIYPVGTLVKLNSGKIGLISKLNTRKPLQPCVRVFYNTRMNQTIAIEEIDLSNSKYRDQIDCCVRPEEFNLNLLGFFKMAFID